MGNNSQNQDISGSIGSPRDFKVFEIPSLTDNTLGLIGTSQKGPAFVPKTFQTFTSNNEPNGILNNFEDTFGRLNDLEEINVSQLTAYEWFNQGGEQLTFVRTLGLGYKGVEDSTSGIVSGSGFYVGKEVVSGSSNENMLASNSFSDGEYHGKVNFICSNYESNNYVTSGSNNRFSSTNDYLEQIGINNSDPAFLINDVVLCPSGSQLLFALNSIEDGSLDGISNSIEASFTSGTLGVNSSVKKSYVFVRGLKNKDRNIITNYNFDTLKNEKRSYSSEFFNHKTDNFLHKGHLNYLSCYSSKGLIKNKAYDNIFHTIVTGSNASNTPVYENFESKYKTAKTPWIVSQPVNRSQIEDNRTNIHEKCLKLFRFYAYDDGEAGNAFRIGVKPQRLGNKKTKEWSIFSIIVQKYDIISNSYDDIFNITDLNLNPESKDYIGRVIGTKHFFYNTETGKIEESGYYEQKNNFIRVEISEEIEFNERESYELMPSGFMPYPIINNTGLGFSSGESLVYPKFNPVPYISNLLRKNRITLSEDKYWGVRFDDETSLYLPNQIISGTNYTVRMQKKIDSTPDNFQDFYPYTKYFQDSFIAKSLNTWKYELEEDSVDSTNSFFHLEKIMYLKNLIENDSSLSDYWNLSFYRRDGKKSSEITSLGSVSGSYDYLNIDEILKSDTESDSKHSDYLRFDLFTYGGFDGVNILDNDKKRLNQTAFVRETEDETDSNVYTGPTRFSYETSHNLIVDEGNCEVDILTFGEVGHNKFNKLVSNAAGENQKYLVILNASEFYSSRIVKNYNFYTTAPEISLDEPNSRQNLLFNDLRNDLSEGSDVALANISEKFFNNKFTLNVCNSVSCILQESALSDSSIVDRKFVAMPSFVAVKSIGSLLRKPLDSVVSQNSSIIKTSFVFNDIFDNEQNNEYSQIVRNSQSSNLNLNFIINNSSFIKLNSSNTAQVNRNSLNRLAHNVRIMLDIKKKLKYDIVQSEIMFNNNSASSQLGLLLRSIIDNRLNKYKVNRIIKNYFVSIENSSSSINRANMLNNLLRTKIAISLFGKDDNGSIEEFTLTDILNSTQNNLTEIASQNILTVKI